MCVGREDLNLRHPEREESAVTGGDVGWVYAAAGPTLVRAATHILHFPFLLFFTWKLPVINTIIAES